MMLSHETVLVNQPIELKKCNRALLQIKISKAYVLYLIFIFLMTQKMYKNKR